MSRRTLVLAGSLLLIAALWTRGAGPQAQPPARAPRVEAPRPEVPPPAAEPEPAPARDPFRYGDEVRARPPAVPDEPEQVREAPAAPAAPLRLVGFVRRGGRLEAALSHEGEVSLVAPGDSIAGYTLLEADEDSGVLLRGAGGAELRLAVPE